ncbi:MAG: sigma-70 family RNA polymerase sigma factor [Lachnospiraceae bacterium]|nr:sigma-70 family RNA polymerase sigma factor [Lachnospiraceae bacterium]
MEKRYAGMSDEELITEFRDGDGDVIDYLMEKYKDLVRKQAGSMYILGGDTQDLIQEGMIGLFKAVREYDSGRDASFSTFARLCVSRQIYSAVKASGRKKHMPLNSYISLYSNARETEDGKKEMPLGEMLMAGHEMEPESIVLEQERKEELAETIEKDLSPLERSVLDLYITGMTYTEIAQVLGRDEKSTDNALQRIRGKLRKYVYYAP